MRKFLGSKGQTAIEYILLVAAMSAIIFSIMGYIRDSMVSEDCGANPDSLGCKIQGIYGSIGTSNNFRYFTVRR